MVCTAYRSEGPRCTIGLVTSDRVGGPLVKSALVTLGTDAELVYLLR